MNKRKEKKELINSMSREEQLKSLKEYLLEDIDKISKRANSKHIRAKYPILYEEIKDDFRAKLYMLLYDIDEIPKCANPNCNNKVELRSFKLGFRKCCCNACVGQYQKTDEEFAKKISLTCSNKNKNNNRFINNELYANITVDYNENGNFKDIVTIKDYCKHGNISIRRNTLEAYQLSNTCLCEQCCQELFESYIPTDDEIESFQNIFDKFYVNNNRAIKHSWLLRHYPKEYKIILTWSEHLKDISLPERILLFRLKLKNPPLCANCGKNHVRYNVSGNNYNWFCDSYACQVSTSKAEIDVYNYLHNIDNNIKHKKRIGTREYDIVSEEHKILIEYNGLHWHSDKIIDDKKYHIKKYQLAKDNGYRVINIWEDDWLNKQDICKSLLQHKLNLIKNKIDARKCIIKLVTNDDTKLFLEANHIQGNCASSINLGLYYDNELVSLMTFGKSRMITSTVDKYEYELIRFCNKVYTNVRGGASKLWKYFIDEYKPYSVISYANLDISDGGLYDALGFKFISHTGINYWWVKGKKRYHRSNFMKHKLVEQGFNTDLSENDIMHLRGFSKIWGLGNLKYEWYNNLSI